MSGRSRRIAGVMSGTSADGLDVALVEFGRAPSWRWRLLGFRHAGYTPRERRAILELAGGSGGVAEAARLDRWLGERIGRAVLAACRQTRLNPERLDLVASHGQTVFHAGRQATLQVGDAATIAAITGRPVVANFRAADIAQGGEGAPLVPWVDWRLYTHRRRYRAALNLGGIANLTLLPPLAGAEDVVGFDTGPGNMALDALMQQLSHGQQSFDRNGDLGAQGKVDERLLSHLLRHAFFRRPPPKSAGREQFGEAYVSQVRRQAGGMKAADLMATLVALTAASVARGLAQSGRAGAGAEVVVSGGGVRNRALMQALAAAAPEWRWLRSEALGVPSQAKEAIAFAFLGEAHLRGVPANLPRVTGARRAVLLGSYTPGPPW